jgi:hypothetical protein
MIERLFGICPACRRVDFRTISIPERRLSVVERLEQRTVLTVNHGIWCSPQRSIPRSFPSHNNKMHALLRKTLQFRAVRGTRGGLPRCFVHPVLLSLSVEGTEQRCERVRSRNRNRSCDGRRERESLGRGNRRWTFSAHHRLETDRSTSEDTFERRRLNGDHSARDPTAGAGVRRAAHPVGGGRRRAQPGIMFTDHPRRRTRNPRRRPLSPIPTR